MGQGRRLGHDRAIRHIKSCPEGVKDQGPSAARSSRSSFHLRLSCHECVVSSSSRCRRLSGSRVHADQPWGWLCDGCDPTDCGLRDLAVRPAVAGIGGRVGGCCPCGLPGHCRVVGPRWCRGPRTSRCALAGPGALVPDCSVLRSCRCDADLARDLRPASSSSTRPEAGRELLRRSQPSFCCNWCYFNLPRRLDSLGSSSITGRTATAL